MATTVAQHHFANTTIGGGAVVQQGDRQTTNTYYIEHASIGLRDVPHGPDLAQLLCSAAERLHEVGTRCIPCTQRSVHEQTVHESSSSRRFYSSEVSSGHLATKARPGEQRAVADGRRIYKSASQTSKLSQEAKEARVQYVRENTSIVPESNTCHKGYAIFQRRGVQLVEIHTCRSEAGKHAKTYRRRYGRKPAG